jgi:hypothetical protein
LVLKSDFDDIEVSENNLDSENYSLKDLFFNYYCDLNRKTKWDNFILGYIIELFIDRNNASTYEIAKYFTNNYRKINARNLSRVHCWYKWSKKYPILFILKNVKYSYICKIGNDQNLISHLKTRTEQCNNNTLIAIEKKLENIIAHCYRFSMKHNPKIFN